MQNFETPTLSVVSPCFNESKNIPALVSRLCAVFDRMGVRGEIILVDDGSFDDTAAVIRRMVAEHPGVVHGEYHEKNKGIEAGWKTGLTSARADIVCFIDSDLQNLPEDIARLYREYKRTGVDIVQGWRSNIGREKGVRYHLSVLLNGLLNVLFGMHARDNKSGFVLARKEVFADILHHRFRYHYFQTFIRVAGNAKGYFIIEVETLFDKRRVGKSFLADFPLRVIACTFSDLAKGFIEYRLFRQNVSHLARFLADHPTHDRSEEYSFLRKLYFRFYVALMPLHHWLIGRDAADYFWLLRKSQWLKPDEVRKLQFERLKAILEHAYRHVAFYRNRFDDLDITPNDIQSLDDLAKLPLLDKKTIRQHLYFDMLSDNHDKKEILRISTSGSTGEPFVCFADRSQLDIRWATTLRSQEWTGYRFGDRCLRLWHQTIGMTRSQVLRERLDALLCRRRFVPTYEMSKHNLPRTMDMIERYRPVLVDGYAEAFNMLAKYLSAYTGRRFQIPAMMSSAQSLPKHSREVVEREFGTRVFDKYGAREFSGIAYECEAHAGHHVVAESYIVEILKDGRPAQPGEVGEVIVTDLNNRCMPFIRYRIGDLAVATDEVCPCGRGLPLIGEIEGRTQSIIVGNSEQYVPGALFLHLIKDYDHSIRQFQVEQEKRGSVVIRIVKGERYTDEVMDEVCAILDRYLGPNMEFDIRHVDEIPLGRTGKLQVSISRLELDFQKVIGVDVRAGSDPGRSRN